MRVTVIGGCGRTGSGIVRLLRADGHDTVVMARTPGSDEHLVRGSITDRDAVERAARDSDAVVVVVESDDDGDGPNAPGRVHVEGLANVLAKTSRSARVVLVSQIYITRPERMPEVRAVIDARAEAETLLRSSGRSYAIVRPGWLNEEPSGGVHLEQGDTGDGPVSRSTVARACVAAVVHTHRLATTFEVFDSPDREPPDWAALLEGLTQDTPIHHE